MAEQGNEGDEIILMAFRQIECQIDENINKIGQLTADHIVEIIARSLQLISNNEIKYNKSLPSNIAARHRICTTMASKVKDLGFPGQCGYNELLYPMEAQTKSMLTWLVQKLPRSEEEMAEEILGPNALLNRRMIEKLMQWKHSPWRLPFCATGAPLKNIYKKNRFTTLDKSATTAKDIFTTCSLEKIPAEPTFFERNRLEVIYDKLYAEELENNFEGSKRKKGKSDVLQGLIRNALSAAKASDDDMSDRSLLDIINSIENDAGFLQRSGGRGTRFSHAAEFEQEKGLTMGGGKDILKSANLANKESSEEADARKQAAEREERERVEELERLRKAVEDTANLQESEGRAASNAASKIRQLESELAALLSEVEHLERELTVKKKTLEMLPQAVENIAKLQSICAVSSKRLMTLAQEWESHRRPLVDELRAKTANKSQRKLRCRAMLEEMKRCREEMVAMIQDLRDKQERSQTLSDEISKIPKNINRGVYTHRIMDIIAQINKQNRDIDKITGDIRDVQKSINSATSAMQRADGVAEETVYSGASVDNRDPAAVESYRKLMAMREKFEALVDTVSKIGQAEKAGRDLETKLDQEQSRVSANNFERIATDLREVVEDNSQLVLKIRQLSKQ